MRRLLPLLLLAAVPSLAAPAAAVRGRIVIADGVAPGVTVTLAGKSATTNERGEYAFDGIEPGLRVVRAELDGVGITGTVIEVKAGENEAPDVALPWETWPEVTMDCRPCGQDPPETEWDHPTCADYTLDESLIATAKQGDRSAVTLLETRHRHATTYTERFLIAEGLLGRSKDDPDVWREIERHAETAVRFFDGTDESKEKFEAYCAERGYPADRYESVVWAALSVAMPDQRSRPLLLRALESGDSMMVYGAIVGLASQKDETTLPAIEKVLARLEDPEHVALALREFGSPAADAVALKFVEGEAYFDEAEENHR